MREEKVTIVGLSDESTTISRRAAKQFFNDCAKGSEIHEVIASDCVNIASQEKRWRSGAIGKKRTKMLQFLPSGKIAC